MIKKLVALGSAFSSGFVCSYIFQHEKSTEKQINLDDGTPIFSKLYRDITLEAEAPNDAISSKNTSSLELIGPSGISKDTSNIASPHRLGEIMKHGYPSLDNLRIFDNYVLSYDRRNRVANWVFEHLKPTMLIPLENTDRGKSEFKEDDQIHPYFRSTNQDFKG
jgi:DNA/RNA endonuclease G (NUC1)